MELSIVGNSQGLVGGGELTIPVELKRVCVPLRRNRVCFLHRCDWTRNWAKSGVKASLKAAQIEPARSNELRGRGSATSRSDSLDKVRLFVGLPLDAVSDDQTINHARAVAAGLKALKLLGVEGVELPVWWGIVEKEAMGQYNWSGYLELAEMVQDAGLKLHVSLCFHASSWPKIKLPDWVAQIGESQPDIYFKDRSGKQYPDCLSLAVDELPVLGGKTPVQVYREFCESFNWAFAGFMESTITGITIGLGPGGDLRYPSHHKAVKEGEISGVGEFQCYDKHMLAFLKQSAEKVGNPLWGNGGPHDAPRYNQTPTATNFFKDHGGSWESPYGKFFLNWYSSQLLSHGDRLLSMASNVFKDSSGSVYGRVPLIHSWYKTRSHASEQTAGFINTEGNNGYDAVAEMFSRNSCKMIMPGMDLLDEHQPKETLSSPEMLLSQMRTACVNHGVDTALQNAGLSKNGLEKMRTNLAGKEMVDLFMYQRMGAEFFSPEHFPAFTQFVWSLSQPEMHPDDLPQGEMAVSGKVSSATELQKQVA